MIFWVKSLFQFGRNKLWTGQIRSNKHYTQTYPFEENYGPVAPWF